MVEHASRVTRRRRRRRLLLVLAAVAASIGGVILVIAATQGFDGLVRLFSTRWLEARSGRKYTPTGAVKRHFEKLEEAPE